MLFMGLLLSYGGLFQGVSHTSGTSLKVSSPHAVCCVGGLTSGTHFLSYINSCVHRLSSSYGNI